MRKDEYYGWCNAIVLKKVASLPQMSSCGVGDRKGIRFSTYICYDLRFPEWSWNHGEYDRCNLYCRSRPESRTRRLRIDFCGNELSRMRRMSLPLIVPAPALNGNSTYRGESCVIAPDGEVRAKCRDYRDDIVVYKVMK